jgi:hypothetical protein
MADLDTKPSDQIRYQRIRGLWRTGTLNLSSLFMGGDHLLLCDYRGGFTERYKRFYLSDIQAIIVRRTMHWLGGAATWGFFAFCFLVIALTTHWNRFLEIMVGICLLFTLRHLVRGPSCRTHIRTAVQIDALPMLKRVRKTNRILGRLFPLIEQAQGNIAENIAAAPGASPSSSRNVIAMGVSTAAAPSPVMARQELSWFHVFTFGAVLLSGLNAVWEVNYPSLTSYSLLLALFGLSVVIGIVALVRQARHHVHRGAFALIWVQVITFVLGAGGIDYVFTMVNIFNRARTEPQSRPPTIVNFLSPFQLRHMTGFDAVLWSYGVWALLLGLLGLIFVFMPGPAKRNPPPLPAETHP